MKCRHCNFILKNVFLDLGFAPHSNAYLSEEDLKSPERYFPLKTYVCDKCWLVQTEDFSLAEELFTKNYAYFSSASSTWLNHASIYVDMITNRLNLNKDKFVIEIASNDGYLLKNFISNGIPCLGIEPTKSTASIAKLLDIPVEEEFFSKKYASELVEKGIIADLIIGNNVFAHVPDINDFTNGMKLLLRQGGTITLEFPHLLNLIKLNQFDTIYHEHFSYLSLNSVMKIFNESGLRVYDVEQLKTHGGSLRIFGCHIEDKRKQNEAVENILSEEIESGLQELKIYKNFQVKINKVKNDLLEFLIDVNKKGKKIAAYGAAAKGNTLLNYAGIKSDLVSFVCDISDSKQGKFMPGSHIPIYTQKAITDYKPDFVFILPWNLTNEIEKENNYIRSWGGRFVTAIPELKIF